MLSLLLFQRTRVLGAVKARSLRSRPASPAEGLDCACARGGGGEQLWTEQKERFVMGGGLRVLDEIVSLVVDVTRVVGEVRVHNGELASQLERAWCRVATGTGEGQMRRGNKGKNRFDDALGEAKEAHAALRYAAACSYAKVDAQLLRRVDGVAAVLYRLARR